MWTILLCVWQIWDIPVTRWLGVGKPITKREYEARAGPPEPYRMGRVYQMPSPVVLTTKDSGLVNLLVNSTIYTEIESSIAQYIADVEASGYTVAVDTVLGGLPDSIRSHLVSQLPEGLLGAVLIGDFPVPWFQLMNTFEGMPPFFEEFPIDLFYMDLDGVWLDTLTYDSLNDTLIPGCDSIFDTHYGEMAPDIWLGRLTASTLNWEAEVDLLNKYFDKNHLYRIGELSLNKRALNYVDDDWAYLPELTHPGLDSLYPSVDVITHPETTCAENYKPRLKANYEWVGLFCHSSPFAHYFECYDTSAGLVYNSDIYSIRPIASFYNLFACSNARYVEENYMGGWYVFVDSCGLGAIGSTKTGSMLEFQDFYYPLGEGKSLGETFKSWFAKWGEAAGDTSRSWFYGMTLIGDPTLVPKAPQGVEEEVDRGLQKLYAYPNPFSGVVRIDLPGVSKDKKLTFRIYNLSGSLVTTLRPLTLPATWDATGLPSSIYFVKYKESGFTYYKKLILIRD